MAAFSEYDQYDALGLAELVRTGQVTPLELADACIERIESGNGALNAVIHKMYDFGRAVAGSSLPDGPFRGVPFLLKDLEAVLAGHPLSLGSRSMAGFVPEHDSAMVQRFKQAGLVILGKTNCPEFGLMGVTEPEAHGPTRNPWNLNHTPGGSSGGSAAAVAAGFLPMASGGDGGGSLRIPASCCGLFGLKPSRGRVPLGPDYGELWMGAVVSHVLTKSVRDSAAMLDAVAGPDPGAPYLITAPERPYLEEVGRDPGKLRVAFSTRSPLGDPVHPDCIEAVHQTARRLEGMGHHVEEAEPEYDGLALMRSFFHLYFGEVSATIHLLQTQYDRAHRAGDVEPGTWAIKLLGDRLRAGEFVFSRYRWNHAARAVGQFFETYQLWLTPVLASPPVKIGEMVPKPAERLALKIINSLGAGWLYSLTGTVEKVMRHNLGRMPFTQLGNLTGIPGVSLPMHRSSEGLPVGVQAMARLGDEATLFRVGAALEPHFIRSYA